MTAPIFDRNDCCLPDRTAARLGAIQKSVAETSGCSSDDDRRWIGRGWSPSVDGWRVTQRTRAALDACVGANAPRPLRRCTFGHASITNGERPARRPGSYAGDIASGYADPRAIRLAHSQRESETCPKYHWSGVAGDSRKLLSRSKGFLNYTRSVEVISWQ